MRLIDAEALIYALTTIDRLARSDAQAALLGRVYYIVSKRPTIDAVPVRHGFWKTRTAKVRLFSEWHDKEISFCSECFAEGKGYKYCPNCGARMDGDEDTNVPSKEDGENTAAD